MSPTGSIVEKDFFVFVDPEEWLIQHQIGLVGSFVAAPEPGAQTMMFLPNPEFKTFITPFQSNMVRNYIAEYNLEMSRIYNFPQYPCRLQSLFLFESIDEAIKYRAHNEEHVSKRILKKCTTQGPFLYSTHDSSWIDFLRLGHGMDDATVKFIGAAYWSGELVKDHTLISMGKPWTREPIMETLLIGRVNFPDKSLTRDSCCLPQTA